RQRRPLVRRAIHVVFLPAVDEIGKRAPDPLKHVSRFLLCPVKSILDAPFDAPERAASLVTIIIVLYIFYGRAGKHSFCLLHRAAHRSDMNRADWARRSAQKSDDPRRFAAFISAQGVIDRCKTGVR